LIKIHPEKICTVPYQDKDDPEISFSVTFKFPYSEDTPINSGEEPIAYILRIIQKSIVSTEGIIDSITNREIEMNDNTRKHIYDIIKTMPDYIYKIAAAYMGPKGKNWLTGVMALLTTDGHPENAPPASLPATESVSLS
jgi:hypothetical protein